MPPGIGFLYKEISDRVYDCCKYFVDAISAMNLQPSVIQQLELLDGLQRMFDDGHVRISFSPQGLGLVPVPVAANDDSDVEPLIPGASTNQDQDRVLGSPSNRKKEYQTWQIMITRHPSHPELRTTTRPMAHELTNLRNPWLMIIVLF